MQQVLSTAPQAPAGAPRVQFEQFWVEAGPLGQPQEAAAGFVATPSVRGHLRNLARAVQLRKHPILLQVSRLAASPGLSPAHQAPPNLDQVDVSLLSEG